MISEKQKAMQHCLIIGLTWRIIPTLDRKLHRCWSRDHSIVDQLIRKGIRTGHTIVWYVMDSVDDVGDLGAGLVQRICQ